MDLTQARAEIDRVDSQIVQLLARRAQLVEIIGRLKGRPEIVRDPVREERVIARVRQEAEAHGFDPDFTAALYRRMMDYFVERQLKQLIQEE